MNRKAVTAKRSTVRHQAFVPGSMAVSIRPDSWVLIPALVLLCTGIVMVGSASIAIAESQGAAPYHYLARHLVFVVLGVILASSLRIIPMAFLERISKPMALLSILFLALVLVPGLGHTVNGSTRWVSAGFPEFPDGRSGQADGHHLHGRLPGAQGGTGADTVF